MVNDYGLWPTLKKYFYVHIDEETEKEAIESITEGIAFKGINLWILIFAIFVASLGLNVNSTAVIIGAMLISPLMGPIIGMGLAIGINDFELLKKSFSNYGVATLISVLTATIYFLISPLSEAQSELLARTSPTVYDIMIAFFGGAAGALAVVIKGRTNVVPGVAIATALMPPLCTAGFGLATGQWTFFIGAFYLFFINTVFICLATFLGVRFMGFKAKNSLNPERDKLVRRYIWTVVLLTMIPAAFLTAYTVKMSVLNANFSDYIKEQLNFSGMRIVASDLNVRKKTLRVVAVGKEITKKEIANAEDKLSRYGFKDYSLEFIQGSQSAQEIDNIRNELNEIRLSKTKDSDNSLQREQQLQALEDQLREYTQYEALGRDVCSEAQALFPGIVSVSLAKISEARVEQSSSRSYILALVGVGSEAERRSLDEVKLRLWLMSRIKNDNLRLITALDEPLPESESAEESDPEAEAGNAPDAENAPESKSAPAETEDDESKAAEKKAG
ncbi:DUF389 domain-containing protein [bacterium]|nr:DUF389 domain-containing protein [bacterium]